MVDLEVGLGPLLRGRVQATELRLVAPQIGLGIDRTGAIDWPAASPAFAADALTISRLEVEDGRVTLTDAGSGGRVVLQKLSFNGDIRSFAGPFRGEGAFVVGDELYGYRISGSRIDEDGGLKLRLGVEPSNHPLTAEIDGTLSFNRGVPQFDGTLALARPVGATLARGQRVMNDPWQLAGKLRATPASASLREVAFQYGPDERAVIFSGKAELTFGERPHLDGTVAAVQVDIDRALAAPDVTHRPPLVMIKSFFDAFVAAVKPPIPVAVGIAVDALTVGGTTLQALHGGVGFDDKGWTLDDVEFQAPGFTEVNLSGRLDDGPQGLGFSGPASLESADLKMLMAWLEGRSEPPSGRAETLTARGVITIASDRLALDRLSATLDQENLEGRLAYTWAAGDRPATLDGELRAAKLRRRCADGLRQGGAVQRRLRDAPRGDAPGRCRQGNRRRGGRATGQRPGQVRRRRAAHRPALGRRSGRHRARHQRAHRRIVVATARAADARSRRQNSCRSDQHRRQVGAAGCGDVPPSGRASGAGKGAWRPDRRSPGGRGQYGQARS